MVPSWPVDGRRQPSRNLWTTKWWVSISTHVSWIFFCSSIGVWSSVFGALSREQLIKILFKVFLYYQITTCSICAFFYSFIVANHEECFNLLGSCKLRLIFFGCKKRILITFCEKINSNCYSKKSTRVKWIQTFHSISLSRKRISGY